VLSASRCRGRECALAKPRREQADGVMPMEFTVNRSEFRTAFATAASILFRRDASVLGHVLLAPRDGCFLLTGTNQGTVIQTAVKAPCKFGPNALLPWRVRRVLSAMETKDVSLGLLENAVQISGGRASFSLQTPDPQLYPEPAPIVMDDAHVEVSSRQFRRAVRSTAFATFRFLNITNFALRSVHIAVSGKKLLFTATDGTKVARYAADVTNDPFESVFSSVLISPDLLMRLGHLTRDSTVKMCVKGDTVAMFGLGDSVSATVPLASGSFPKMDEVFATFTREVDHYETVKLTTGDLAALLSLTSVMSTKDHQVLRLSIGRQRLWSEMRTPEVGESRCHIDVASWVDSSPVTLDVQLLRDGLAVLQHNERVWLSIPDKALPLKLGTENYTYIVIPFGDTTQQRHAYNDAIAARR
jgi:DNA polymerase III sliding clamp (beta) subunit (PCNA family)